MENTDVEKHARACAARVDANAVGFDPATIITILTVVLPLIAKCFGKNDESNPAAMRAAVKRQHESAPEILRRRTARRIRGEADEPMTKAQSFALADAVIAECCESDDDTVAAFAVACGV